jgi:tetratricopeptide (TPR) repeat protein
MKTSLLLLLLFLGFPLLRAQQAFTNLPIGKYQVGFKIISITDKSRVSKPLYNYLGEKETGSRHRTFNIHLWYPAKPNTGKGNMTYGEYGYAENMTSLNHPINKEKKTGLLESQRNSFQGFFSAISDADWKKLSETALLSQKEANPLSEKFPLLIGVLRPLSTSITNELMASYGYVIAMIIGDNADASSPQIRYINEVADMQQAIAHLNQTGMIDEERIGTYGFSGSGFSQVLLAMQDKRIGALADIESAIYGEASWDQLAASDYYDAKKLHIPFLHIYGKKLAQGDKHFDDFHKKIYSERYHLQLNYQNLHHWDVATEGRVSTTVLHVRGEKEPFLQDSYELTHQYLLHFFNAVLKKDKSSQQKLTATNTFAQYPDSLWTFKQYPALPPPPDVQQFTEVIQKRGIDTALVIARKFIILDSTAPFLHENAINQLAHTFRRQNKPDEALILMKFATEVHPQEAWLWNNLASMQEDFGNKAEAIRHSEKVLQMLPLTEATDMSFDARIRRNSAARLERLKNSTTN